MNTLSKQSDEFVDGIVMNLNKQVMLDHLEYVELGIRPLDDDFYYALRVRKQSDPKGKFLKLTSRIERAICTAAILHRGQYRKGEESKIPYIIHPLAVAEILAKYTDDENIICAGLLHDTLEDTEYTKERMIDDFGEAGHDEKIFNMVNDVTEQDKSLPWIVRKKHAFDHIAKMSKDSLLVKSADVLHNLTQLNENIKNHGDVVFNKFNASKEDTITRYRNLIPELLKYWPKNPLKEELERELNKLISF